MASTSITITDYRTQIPGELSDDKTVYCFPQINSINNRTGKNTIWRIIVRLYRYVDDERRSEFVEILDEYFDNKPMPAEIYGWIKVISKIEGGKVRDTDPTIVLKGKNPGRANATNVFCQTLRDALGLHNKQLQKTHSAEQNTRVQLLPPMLATLKEDLREPVDYSQPQFVQRKFNGVRAVAVIEPGDDDQGTVIMYSRRRKAYPGFKYIKEELYPMLLWARQKNSAIVYFDGEIYKHGESLQRISGLARKETSEDDLRVEYHVYDCFIPDKPSLLYPERKAILEEIFAAAGNTAYVKPVETVRVRGDAEANELYQRYVAEGYEGAIMRRNLPYRYSFNDYHSTHLLKIKPTYDDEFELVGFTEGKKGKAKGALMLIFKTAKGFEFNVTPKGEINKRKELYEKMSEIEPNGKTHFENNYLGTMMTVEYAELSSDGVPQQSRTDMVIRDYE